MSRHTKDRVSVDISRNANDPVAIATGNPETGRGWEEIGQANHLLGKGREGEKLANARLFADAINVANETGRGPRQLAQRVAELERFVEDMRQELETIANPPSNWGKDTLVTIAKKALAENSTTDARPFADAANKAIDEASEPLAEAPELAAERKKMLDIIFEAAAVYKGMPAPRIGDWNWPDMAKQCDEVLANEAKRTKKVKQ